MSCTVHWRWAEPSGRCLDQAFNSSTQSGRNPCCTLPPSFSAVGRSDCPQRRAAPPGGAHGCKWLRNCTSSQGFGMEVRRVPLLVSAPTAAQKQPVATLPQPGRTQLFAAAGLRLIENPQACTTQKHPPAHCFATRHFGCRVCLGAPLRRFTAVAESCRSGAGPTPSPPILHEEADPPPSPPAPLVQKYLTKTPGGNPCHQRRCGGNY
jgi:hypothetical protein